CLLRDVSFRRGSGAGGQCRGFARGRLSQSALWRGRAGAAAAERAGPGQSGRSGHGLDTRSRRRDVRAIDDMKLTKLIASPTVFWYLTRRLAGPVLVALAVFTLVDVLGEGADRFAGWFRSGVAIDGFGYLALRVPFMVSQLMPVAILGGVMFAFAMLHRAEEVIAIQAVGISRAQMSLPVFALGIALSLGNFALAEG